MSMMDWFGNAVGGDGQRHGLYHLRVEVGVAGGAGQRARRDGVRGDDGAITQDLRHNARVVAFQEFLISAFRRSGGQIPAGARAGADTGAGGDP
jgi:hypothetical protein